MANKTQEERTDELINNFIQKWIPQYYPHLIDTDENDGEELRNNLKEQVKKAREEGKKIASQNKAEDYCGNERPARKTLCQLKKGHKGSHRAVIFWEGERK